MAPNDSHRSATGKNNCETAKFNLFRLGSAVAGSNPVSPTQVRSHFRTKLWSLIRTAYANGATKINCTLQTL